MPSEWEEIALLYELLELQVLSGRFPAGCGGHLPTQIIDDHRDGCGFLERTVT